MLLSLLVGGDSCDNYLALFYAGTDPYFVQLQPSSYRCAKGRHGVDWFCYQVPPLPLWPRTLSLPHRWFTHLALTEQLLCLITSSPPVFHGVNCLKIKGVSISSEAQKTETAAHMC